MIIGLGIPTQNAGSRWRDVLESYQRQTLLPQKRIIVDTSSTDNTVSLAREFGFDVISIGASEFRHGRVRNQILSALEPIDILVLATQDVLLASPYTLEKLIQGLISQDDVGAVFGRQLPYPEATPFAAHARYFNYPAVSQWKRIEDKDKMGIKTAFFSNSFAAYRVAVLKEVGGFPDELNFGEDMYVASKILLSGKIIGYLADATVFHSHNYTVSQEFQRYFDIGMFHANCRWILDILGNTKGEGLRFAVSEYRYILTHAPWLLPWVPCRHFAKWLGYWLGLKYTRLSPRVKSLLSMYSKR